MKKIIALAIAALLGLSGAQAQLVKSRTFGEKEPVKLNIGGYNRLSLAYDAQFFKYKAYGESETITGNGFNLTYIHGFEVTKKLPLFVEAGLGLGFNSGSKKYEENVYGDNYGFYQKYNLSNFWIKVPINVAYKLPLADNISLLPYTGINFKFNCTLDSKYTDYRYDEEYDSENWSLLEDGEGGKVFQMGWQIGVGVNISKLYVGLQYGIDFMPIANEYPLKITTQNLAVSVGLTW